jgi:hypothetical protein
LHGTRASAELIGRVRACLAEGVGIRGTARVGEIDPKTVLGWWGEAAEQRHAVAAYVLPELHRHQVQLAALSAVRSAVSEGDVSAAAALAQLARSPYWVGTAIAPETQWRLRVQGGARTLALAPAVLHPIAQGLAPGGATLSA